MERRSRRGTKRRGGVLPGDPEAGEVPNDEYLGYTSHESLINNPWQRDLWLREAPPRIRPNRERLIGALDRFERLYRNPTNASRAQEILGNSAQSVLELVTSIEQSAFHDVQVDSHFVDAILNALFAANEDGTSHGDEVWAARSHITEDRNGELEHRLGILARAMDKFGRLSTVQSLQNLREYLPPEIVLHGVSEYLPGIDEVRHYVSPPRRNPLPASEPEVKQRERKEQAIPLPRTPRDSREDRFFAEELARRELGLPNTFIEANRRHLPPSSFSGPSLPIDEETQAAIERSRQQRRLERGEEAAWRRMQHGMSPAEIIRDDAEYRETTRQFEAEMARRAAAEEAFMAEQMAQLNHAGAGIWRSKKRQRGGMNPGDQPRRKLLNAIPHARENLRYSPALQHLVTRIRHLLEIISYYNSNPDLPLVVRPAFLPTVSSAVSSSIYEGVSHSAKVLDARKYILSDHYHVLEPVLLQLAKELDKLPQAVAPFVEASAVEHLQNYLPPEIVLHGISPYVAPLSGLSESFSNQPQRERDRLRREEEEDL